MSGEPSESGRTVAAGRDLAADYPACFDWANPRPLKRKLHKDLASLQGAALLGADVAAFRRQVRAALADYCTRPAYLAALLPGAVRIDLEGQPAGAVTDLEAEYAQARLRGERPLPVATCKHPRPDLQTSRFSARISCVLVTWCRRPGSARRPPPGSPSGCCAPARPRGSHPQS